MEEGNHVQLSGVPLWGNPKTLAAAGGGSESINLFQILGCVDILSLRCEVTTVLSAGPLTAALFELYDGAAAVALTLNNGVLTSRPVGTVFSKMDVAAVTMAVADPTAGALLEHATQMHTYKNFRVIQKTGTNTYIRLTYANGGGGAATGAIRPGLIWRPISQNGSVIPV